MIRQGSLATINGYAFGERLPKVWLESIHGNKVYKYTLKVDRYTVYENAQGKAQKSCTDPVTGASLIRVSVPERAWPKGFVAGENWTLVIDNGYGLATYPARSIH